MAINKDLLNSLLDNLKNTLNKVGRMDITLEKILEDEDTQDLIDRRMQVALENCIDIATHLSSGLDLPRKERAADIFLQLAEREIISKDLADKLVGAVGFRNILVHEYTEIDYQLAYSDLSQKLEDLRQFAKEVFEFVEKQ